MEAQLIEQTKKEYEKLLLENKLASALPLIKQAAHWSDTDSQILAAQVYLHGQYGHPRSDKDGFEYARLAAMNEDPGSMYDLAMLYQNGAGMVHDLEKSKYWLEKAARYGYAPAMDALGMFYLQGRGVQRNVRLALDWFKKGANAGIDPDISFRHVLMAQKRLAKEEKNT